VAVIGTWLVRVLIMLDFNKRVYNHQPGASHLVPSCREPNRPPVLRWGCFKIWVNTKNIGSRSHNHECGRRVGGPRTAAQRYCARH
jgi:hypothetical protein